MAANMVLQARRRREERQLPGSTWRVRSPRPRAACRVLLLCLFVGLCACGRLGIGVTKISDITARPGEYTGRDVTIRGSVVDAWQVPLIGIRTYTVKDDSGSSIAVATDGETPLAGVKVTVTGTVSNVAVLGGRPLGLHVKERQRR